LRIFNPRDFGASGNGQALDSPAINAAVNACSAAGGGVVYLAPGVYLSGTVILKSNVTLYLEAGATLLGSKTLTDYTPQPGPPGKGDANQKHLVFARDAENVGIAGRGRIDGQGEAFWVHKPRSVAHEDLWRDVATYDWKPGDRPSPMLEFVSCRHLRLEDVRIENASGWTVRPINCDHVVIRGISIKNPVYGPNTDGLDITGCQDVFVSDCRIDTGDDAICLKSENPYGGEPRLGRNITITNCVLTCCCNGLKFGTATRGGFENVTFSNSVISNENVPLNARVISGIALEMVDGGWLEGVTISNIQMQRTRTPIFIRRGIRRARPDGTPGILRGIMIENVHATGSILTSSVTGLPDFPVEDVTLSNIRIESEEAGKEEWVSREVPEVPKAYPEARMFGRLPSYGFYCRHVSGLHLRNVDITAAAEEARPALVCDDVTGLRLNGFAANRGSKSQPVVRLTNSRDAWLYNCAAPQDTKAFLALEGERTQHITMSGCNLAGIEIPVTRGDRVPADSITLFANSKEV
jgi:polygalacturonase